MLGLQVVQHVHLSHILEATVNTIQVAHGQQGTEVTSLTPTTSNVDMALSPVGVQGKQRCWVCSVGQRKVTQQHFLRLVKPLADGFGCFKKRDMHDDAAMCL